MKGFGYFLAKAAFNPATHKLGRNDVRWEQDYPERELGMYDSGCFVKTNKGTPKI